MCIVEKTPPKSIMSSWLGSLSSTVKYGNQVFDAVHKRTNSMVNVLPSKTLLGSSDKLGSVI